MHSIITRFGALFTSTITAIGLVMFLCFLTSTFDNPSASVKLNVKRAVVDSANDYSISKERNNDVGNFLLDLETSFNNILNWNVKQLFVYLVAEYQTEKNQRSEVVLWDKIITKGSNTEINIKGIKPKYSLWDDGHGLIGNKNITLTLRWNCVPLVGAIKYFTAVGSTSFAFPDQYVRIR